MNFANFHRKVQLTLDCGQKQFGSTCCKGCGMVYTIGDPDDIKAHKTYHRAKLSPSVRLPRGPHQRIVEEHFDGSHIVELFINTSIGMNWFTRIADLMNRDLGCDKPFVHDHSNGSAYVKNTCDNWRVFLCVIDKSRLVVGCCVVEELTAERISKGGYKFRRLKGGRQSLLSWQIQNSELKYPLKQKNMEYSNECSQEVVINEPLCGVRRLWVSNKFRRQGIATALIDAILQSLVYGYSLKRSQTAFTEPTANGADFAAFYVGREDFLIY